MTLYKITLIVVIFSIIYGFLSASYYRGNPYEYKKQLDDPGFNNLVFCGLIVVISAVLIFLSILKFIILL